MRISTLLFFFCISGLYSIYAAPIRVVCMGNSITHGNINRSTNTINQMSYRFALWQKLDSAGMEVDMVGYTNLWFDENFNNLVTPPSSQYTGHVFDRDHDAYYGITSDGLINGSSSTGWTGAALPSLAIRLNSYTADIALLHIGTNDNDALVNTTIANIKAIIDALRVKNPNVVVFVAKTITSWKAINAKVDQIAIDKNTAQSPVIGVDLATGFINDTKLVGCMTYDWVHPNSLGQEFMAKRWFAAIQKQLNATTGISNDIASPDMVEVYPAISQGHVSITNANNAFIQVFSVTGKMLKSLDVKETGTIQLNLSDLNNGLYIVKINQNGKAISNKIVIQK